LSDAPPFWFEKPAIAARSLSPVAAIYGHIAARRMLRSPTAKASVPVLCIGNFIAGGAGKTPTAIAVAKIARNMGLRPGFLSRGYGGSIKRPTVVDVREHTANEVGDEPMILAVYATTVVAANRPAGATLLEQNGVDFIIMDDGFQNPSLHKDYSLVVVDAGRGIGNGYCMPAGPLRASFQAQLSHANAVLLIGQSDAGTEVVRKSAKTAKPIFQAEIAVRKPANWQDKRVMAYAGIADPSKFFNSLESVGAEVAERRSFADHHRYGVQECRDLMEQAEKAGLMLATTEKDFVRLNQAGPEQQKLLESSEILYVDLEFENSKTVESMLQETIRRAEEFRLSNG